MNLSIFKDLIQNYPFSLRVFSETALVDANFGDSQNQITQLAIEALEGNKIALFKFLSEKLNLLGNATISEEDFPKIEQAIRTRIALI